MCLYSIILMNWNLPVWQNNAKYMYILCSQGNGTNVVCFLSSFPLLPPATMAEAESKEKHGVWDPMSELTISLTLCHCPLQSRLQHIYHGQPYAKVDPNLCQSRLYPSVWDFSLSVRSYLSSLYY
jgi:hypothetical protein